VHPRHTTTGYERTNLRLLRKNIVLASAAERQQAGELVWDHPGLICYFRLS
jgi:hypothetical protein